MQAGRHRHVRASIATAQPDPTRDDEDGTDAGPMIAEPDPGKPIMALACWMWLRGTTCGTIASIAGKVNAANVPLRPRAR